MIKVHELRVGNVVRWKQTADLLRQGWYVAIIVEINGVRNTVRVDGGILRTNLSIENDIIPIGLTPEILTEWCGFVAGGSKWHLRLQMPQNKCTEVYCKKQDDDNWLTITFKSHLFMGEKPVRYLHELQNLFFLLTDSELEIKIQANA